MRQWLTGEDLVNNLVMLRTTDKRAFVITEGDADCQALDPHVDETLAETFVAGSKSVASVALGLIDQRSLRRILIILDRDWVGMLSAPIVSPNVVYTDLYDLDVTMMRAGKVFDRVISAHSHRDSRRAHLAIVGMTADALVVEIAVHVGVLRHASERDGMGISCAAFPVGAAVTAAHDGVDVSMLVHVAVSKSDQPAVAAAHAKSVLQNDLASIAPRDRIEYCSGHDLAAAVSVLSRHWGGSASPKVIEQAVRAAFSCAELMATRLYQAVVTWATREGTTIWNCT